MFESDRSIYLLRYIQQKNRVIRRFEYVTKDDYNLTIKTRKQERETVRRAAVSRIVKRFL